jgi:hypothetical protein
MPPSDAQLRGRAELIEHANERRRYLPRAAACSRIQRMMGDGSFGCHARFRGCHARFHSSKSPGQGSSKSATRVVGRGTFHRGEQGGNQA